MKDASHIKAITDTAFLEAMVQRALLNGLTIATYRSRAMTQRVNTEASKVMHTIAFPANSLHTMSPSVELILKLFIAKSYMPGQNNKVRKSATARFVNK